MGKYAQVALNITTANTAPGKMYYSVISLIGENKIKLYLFFIVAYSKSFFVPHVEWLQKEDPIAKDFGHLSHYMPIITLIIPHELKFLSKNWKMDRRFK